MKKILSDDYISYEDVMTQDEIYVVTNPDGQFFLCFDYYAPAEAKLWYKFSINPFDIDFLKFIKMDFGAVTKGEFSKGGLQRTLSYFHTCRQDLIEINTNFINEVFFAGGVATTKIKNLQKKNDTDTFGRLNVERFYRLKSNLTNKFKSWLKRIYQEYNFLDNSLEYIEDYYNKWIILVNIIQDQKVAIIDPIWRFIKSYEIHSLHEFYLMWQRVVKKEIHVRNIGYNDVLNLNTILFDIIYREKMEE